MSSEQIKNTGGQASEIAHRVKGSVDQVGKMKPAPNNPSQTSKPSNGQNGKSS